MARPLSALVAYTDNLSLLKAEAEGLQQVWAGQGYVVKLPQKPKQKQSACIELAEVQKQNKKQQQQKNHHPGDTALKPKEAKCDREHLWSQHLGVEAGRSGVQSQLQIRNRKKKN